MNLVKLIENIHKEHVHVQGEREQIHQLNIDVRRILTSSLHPQSI